MACSLIMHACMHQGWAQCGLQRCLERQRAAAHRRRRQRVMLSLLATHHLLFSLHRRLEHAVGSADLGRFRAGMSAGHTPTHTVSLALLKSLSVNTCITEHNKNSFIGCPPLIIHLPQGGTSLAGSLCRFDASVLHFAGGHVTLGLE